MAVIRRDAVLANPTAYSQQETEDILRRWHQMLGEFVQRYEIDPLANWEYDIYTGNILDRGTT